MLMLRWATQGQALADYENAIQYAATTAEGNVICAYAYCEKGDYTNAAVWLGRAQQKGWRDDFTLSSIAWFKATCPDGKFRKR